MAITILTNPNQSIISDNNIRLDIDNNTGVIILGDTKCGVLTPEELSAFETVKNIGSSLISGIRPEKLQKTIFRNTVNSVLTIQTQDGGVTTVFLSELSENNQAMAAQFMSMCEQIKPGFNTIEWTAPDKLKIDEITINTSTDMSEEQEIFVFQIGEMLKGISAGIL